MKILSLLCLLAALPVLADERILDFSSDIVVHRSGVLSVTENITVRAESGQIRHGIYRDFPTVYRGRNGLTDRVTFVPLAVELDGEPVPYFTKQVSNGVRLYMGRESRLLPVGVYRFTLTYNTDYQLGYFDNHDELYWNVNGNGWNFPIDRVEATVHLPSGMALERITHEAYTGAFGAKGRDYHSQINSDDTLHFNTTMSLAQEEGLTIVVGWPKGFVHQPTGEERRRWFLHDNGNLLAGLAGLAILLLYYGLVWRAYGRDPEKGVIIPRYEPPAGFSPASARFIRCMGYDNKAFTAAVVNLAVKGVVEIEQRGTKYTLKRLPAVTPSLAAGERALLKQLFKHRDTIELKKSEHGRVGGAMEKHKNSLKRDYEKRYFSTNGVWVIPGVLLSIVMMLVSAKFASTKEEAIIPLFMSIWLTFWSFAVYLLGKMVINSWRHGVVGGIFSLLFATPFFFGEVVGIWVLFSQGGPGIAMVMAMAINVLFYHLLKAPTLAGRKILDKLEGFRLYLEMAEKDEMNLRNPPEKTLQLFETFLPYALALDVEQKWAERFASVFAQMERSQGHYRPTWYHGTAFTSAAVGGFAGGLAGAFTSAISSASTAPGSSSGGGGGGSSGGGGGGGGGGGW